MNSAQSDGCVVLTLTVLLIDPYSKGGSIVVDVKTIEGCFVAVKLEPDCYAIASDRIDPKPRVFAFRDRIGKPQSDIPNLIGFACITHKGNQVVAGMAVTIMVVGLGPTLGLAWFGLGGQTPQLDGAGQRFTGIAWPGAAAAKEMPFPGLLYSELLSGQNLIVYFAAALVPLSAWIFYRTRFGLRLRAVGENPHAVDTAGISVNGLRYQAVIISGVLCGVAGTYLSTAASSGFVRDMTAGKGYLALAALIFGKWKPVPTLFACLLFAFTDALATRLQGVALPVVGVIPVQFILALPYVLTVLLLAGFVGKAVAPRAIGVPYSKEK